MCQYQLVFCCRTKIKSWNLSTVMDWAGIIFCNKIPAKQPVTQNLIVIILMQYNWKAESLFPRSLSIIFRNVLQMVGIFNNQLRLFSIITWWTIFHVVHHYFGHKEREKVTKISGESQNYCVKVTDTMTMMSSLVLSPYSVVISNDCSAPEESWDC